MRKIPECAICLLNAHNPYIVCAIHPSGVSDDNCLDFRPDPKAEPEERWAPEGTEFINGELKIKREPFYYDCSKATLSDYLTLEEKLELLDTHPLFTGRCPRCEMPYPKSEKPPVHWDCPSCHWMDNTV